MLNNLVGDVGNSALANINPVYLFYLLADVGSSHAAAIHANYGLFQLIAHALPLGNELWFKIAFTIPGNVQYQVTQGFRLYFFGIGAIAAVAGVMAFFAVFLITEMFIELAFEHLFNTLLVEFTKK